MIPRMARTRLSLVFWCLVLLAGAITVHLFRLQVMQREYYLAEADRQHKQKIVLQPRRGDILDINGEPLAVSAEGLDVYADPSQIANRNKTAAALASQLDIPRSYVMDRIGQQRAFVMIQQKVNPSRIRALREMKLPGIGFLPSSKRYYPRHAVAAQLIGYVGVDEVGLAGIEFALDSKLRGTPGWLIVQRDARRKLYNMLDYPLQQQCNGLNVRLTIEAEFQEIAEEALRRAVETSGAKNGCVVAVRPSTGEVLAMASYPGVDLNATRSFANGDFQNLATNMPFEPGSTFKPFVACALIGDGHVSLKDTVFCENGRWQIGRRTVPDVHHYGKLSFEEVLSKSSNIGMAKMVQKIDGKKLYRVLRSFGFGNYTGSEFGGEDRGRLNPPDKWDGMTKTSLSFGYGLLVTPLQMAMAYAALANGGVLMEPAIIAGICDDSGKASHVFESHQVRRTVSRDVVDKVRQAMIRVVVDGTGTSAQVPGFEVAGKTGTSMKTAPGGGYGGNGYMSTFGGFFPADDPQLAIYVMINEPSFNLRWGGACAAPVFSEIIRNTMLSSSTVIDRSRLGLSAPEAIIASTDNPKPARPVPPRREGAAAAEDEPALDPSVMPDVRGMSVRRAVGILTGLGLKVKVEGTIRVVNQDPAPESAIRSGQSCTLVAMPSDINETAQSYSMAAGGSEASAAGPRLKKGDPN